MAFNYDYLRIFIKENYGTINKFAEFLGIGTTQIYERLGNRVPFTQKEIDKVANESKAEPLPPRKLRGGEIKLKTPLQTHMENKSKEGKQININSVKEYTVKIKVDTTELDCAIKKIKRLNKLVTKNKLPRVTISTHGNLDEKKIIELLGKYQWK